MEVLVHRLNCLKGHFQGLNRENARRPYYTSMGWIFCKFSEPDQFKSPILGGEKLAGLRPLYRTSVSNYKDSLI